MTPAEQTALALEALRIADDGFARMADAIAAQTEKVAAVKGEQGIAGEPGKDSEVAGPRGEKGAPGAASTVPGPRGETGATGADGADGSDGAQGAPGATGSPGAPGVAGADGRTVLNGDTPPTLEVGAVGDFYIDTTAKTIYGPRRPRTWGAATRLRGPAGASGSSGGGGPTLSNTVPLVESGSGSAGSGTKASRDDHAHPAAGGNGGPIEWPDFVQPDDPGVQPEGTTWLRTAPVIAPDAWQAIQHYVAGARVEPTVPNGHWYVNTLIGDSDAGEPVFPTDGSTVVDGTVLWQDQGLIADVPIGLESLQLYRSDGAGWLMVGVADTIDDALDIVAWDGDGNERGRIRVSDGFEMSGSRDGVQTDQIEAGDGHIRMRHRTSDGTETGEVYIGSNGPRISAYGDRLVEIDAGSNDRLAVARFNSDEGPVDIHVVSDDPALGLVHTTNALALRKNGDALDLWRTTGPGDNDWEQVGAGAGAGTLAATLAAGNDAAGQSIVGATTITGVVDFDDPDPVEILGMPGTGLQSGQHAVITGGGADGGNGAFIQASGGTPTEPGKLRIRSADVFGPGVLVSDGVGGSLAYVQAAFVEPTTATPEAIANALIAVGLMAPA